MPTFFIFIKFGYINTPYHFRFTLYKTFINSEKMAMNVIHTIIPGMVINEGYFDDDNISFIQHRVAEILSAEFIQIFIMSRGDVIRVMERVLEERRENVPKMNQRVIMILASDIRRHQADVNKHLNWEEGYSSSQKLIDPVGRISRFDNWGIKTNDRIKYDNKQRVGGTSRFYFT